MRLSVVTMCMLFLSSQGVKQPRASNDPHTMIRVFSLNCSNTHTHTHTLSLSLSLCLSVCLYPSAFTSPLPSQSPFPLIFSMQWAISNDPNQAPGWETTRSIDDDQIRSLNFRRAATRSFGGVSIY